MSEKDTENFIVGGGVLQRNPDGSFTEVESFNMNIGMNSYDKKNHRTQAQQEFVKEIADFVKSYPHEYMRKCLEQYPYWGNKDNGFDRQNI
nr:MAG TPA: hypothetical protein [Caudoviricetes sp.]